MDDCENTKHEDKSTVKIKKKTMLWIVIGVLLIATIFLTIKASSTGTGGTGKIDTTGWTANDIMNYEMHGTVPAQAASSAASGGMVGGC